MAQSPVVTNEVLDCTHHPTQLVPHIGLATGQQLCIGSFAPTLAQNLTGRKLCWNKQEGSLSLVLTLCLYHRLCTPWIEDLVPWLRQAPQCAIESPRLSSCLFVLLQRSFSLLVLKYCEQNPCLSVPQGNSPSSNGNLLVLIYSQYAHAIAQPTWSTFVSRLALLPQLVPVMR